MKPGCGPEWSSTHAILSDEADRDRYIKAIDGASILLVSAVTRVEMSFVIEGRKREAGRERLERFFNLTATEIVAVTPQQAIIAIGAFRHYGKGRHLAGLNIGDCFSYALASATGHPLLFKGDDFAHTDVLAALR
jgi:ribonuclease VapC